MNIFINNTLLLIISCCLWTTEGRIYVSEITVPNGGPWGSWGNKEFCSEKFADGFELKMSPAREGIDNTALDGIRLFCQNNANEIITSSSSQWWGYWSRKHFCTFGYLVAFSLRVQKYQRKGDDTAVNNIVFRCSEGQILYGNGNDWGEFGPWSDDCPKNAFICGIQTKLEYYQFGGDDTSINDVKFFCCEN